MIIYRVGFTGTSKYEVTRKQLIVLHEFMLGLRSGTHAQVELHHGGAPEADAKAHILAVALGFKTVVHPGPTSRRYDYPYADVILPTRENLIRDEDIAREVEELVAVPHTQKEIIRSGTWTTVRRAILLNKHVTIIWPDGRMS